MITSPVHRKVLADLIAGKEIDLAKHWIHVMDLEVMDCVRLDPQSNGQALIVVTALGKKHDGEKRLTDKQCVALVQARDFGLGAWDCGAGTLGSLKKMGLVTNKTTRVNNEGHTVDAGNSAKYRITEEGLRRLAESGGR